MSFFSRVTVTYASTFILEKLKKKPNGKKICLVTYEGLGVREAAASILLTFQNLWPKMTLWFQIVVWLFLGSFSTCFGSSKQNIAML